MDSFVERRKKMIGQKYNRLTVIGFEYNEKRKRYYAVCECECGNISKVSIDKLISGHTKSCGCLIKDMLIDRNKNILSTHKLSSHPFYTTWILEKQRCEIPSHKSYKNYGARGIKCEWTLEEACAWYDQNPKPSKKHTLDRIDVNGNYNEHNVRWALPTVQAINKEHSKDFKNIYLTKYNTYRVCVNFYGKQHSKTFKTYEEAVLYREQKINERENMYLND